MDAVAAAIPLGSGASWLVTEPCACDRRDFTAVGGLNRCERLRERAGPSAAAEVTSTRTYRECRATVNVCKRPRPVPALAARGENQGIVDAPPQLPRESSSPIPPDEPAHERRTAPPLPFVIAPSSRPSDVLNRRVALLDLAISAVATNNP